MTGNTKSIAEKILSGKPPPPESGIDLHAADHLRAITAEGFDAPAILDASLGSFHPSTALSGFAKITRHPEAAFLLSRENLARVAALGSAAPWIVDLAWGVLGDAFRMPAAHEVLHEIVHAASPEHAAQATGLSARNLSEWRALLLARAALFDLMDEGDPWDALAGYTAAAEAACVQALAEAWRITREAHGVARRSDGELCSFVILGMGKLGGRELNASSDVDLVYFHETDEGAAEDGLSLAEWANELSRHVTDLLGPGGAGLRVDLRLRPGGQFGPLTSSLASAEGHYESFGQAWERQMLIRARPVAGNLRLGNQFLESIRPFVYRRRLDPAALAEIRRIKRRIDAEVAVAAGGDENVKLSRGGIRELEYIVQTYQLLYGGRIERLRTPSLRQALDELSAHNLLPEDDVHVLREAYIFFRRIENRIQIYDGRQNHRLPPEGPVREGLARSMGFATVPEVMLLYDAHRRRVQEIFEALFAADRVEEYGPQEDFGQKEDGVFLIRTLRAASESKFAGAGIPDAAEAFEIFTRLQSAPKIKPLKGARPLLERLAPKIAQLAAQAPDPMGALRGFEQFVLAHGAVEMLLAMLIDDDKMAEVLVRLLGRGSYLSDLLIANPEAFVPLFVAQDVSEGAQAVEQSLIDAAQVGNHDEALAAVRRQKTILELQIALEEIYRPEPETAWRLTCGLARGCVKGLSRIVCRSLGVDEERFGIVLLGSSGNGEPVINSDLDLVFLHDESDGADAITKAAQRILKELESKSAEGFLFRTDLRLRPYGQQGLLVSSLSASKNFYRSFAPVTTRLSLLRARAACGKPAEDFVESLGEVLFAPGFSEEDRAALREIRGKVIEQVPAGRLDVKCSPGTLTDIEFLIGAAQLTHGREMPALRERNSRLAIDALGKNGLISDEECRFLCEALKWYKRLESALRTLYPRPITLLPETPSELHILARMMGYNSSDEMLSVFEGHRSRVERFAKVAS